MDAFFVDPEVERLPPELVRLTDLNAVPLVDRQRVHVRLELTPFEKSPEIELTLVSPEGETCGSSSILEPMGWKMELTMHIRSMPGTGIHGPTAGQYELTAVISYPDIGILDYRTAEFVLPEVTR
jgi:hypothetical protein